jgi:hypothetical protein
MSLNIYNNLNDLPAGMKYIKCNDAFFDSEGIICDDMFSMEILRDIDGAEYVDNYTFKSRYDNFGNLDKIHLSTGAKTALNIYHNPNICFDVCECGNNVLCKILKISDGNILWKMPVLLYRGDSECDIIFDKINYKNIFDFLKVTMR